MYVTHKVSKMFSEFPKSARMVHLLPTLPLRILFSNPWDCVKFVEVSETSTTVVGQCRVSGSSVLNRIK